MVLLKDGSFCWDFASALVLKFLKLRVINTLSIEWFHFGLVEEHASRYKRKAYMHGSEEPYIPPVFDNSYFKQDDGLLPPPAYRVLLKDPLLSLVEKYAAVSKKKQGKERVTYE
ncbi:hypothetical protein M8C21_025024, partial [Ambrosia artemisiifolia]